MLHTNLGTAAARMESLLRGEACPVLKRRLEEEWHLLGANGLLRHHLVLQEVAAFLRNCRIPFLMATPLGLALALFHRSGITAASPLLLGLHPDHVLPFGHSIHPWTILVSSREQDRLGDILARLGVPVRGRHSARLEARIFPGFSGRMKAGELFRSGEYVSCRFRFSRLLGLVSLFEETTGFQPDALAVQEARLHGGFLFPEAGEALLPRELVRFQQAAPVNFPDYLTVFSRRERDDRSATDDRALQRHCAGFLEASRGRLLFREELADILRLMGAVPGPALGTVLTELQEGRGSPAARETFLDGAVGNGLLRREAARVWNSLARQAPFLAPLTGKRTALRLLYWRALVLQERDNGMFRALSGSERLL